LLASTLSFTSETLVEKGFTGIEGCATLPSDWDGGNPLGVQVVEKAGKQ
jgi:hypothetical protein